MNRIRNKKDILIGTIEVERVIRDFYEKLHSASWKTRGKGQVSGHG
jgi:hypothetical protein